MNQVYATGHSPQPSTSRQQHEEYSSDEEDVDNPACYSSGGEESSYEHPEVEGNLSGSEDKQGDGSEEDSDQTPLPDLTRRNNTTRHLRRNTPNTHRQEPMKWTSLHSNVTLF
ncbi:hypothetical protein Pcinc_005936 [Petrolisthes cinctipes]|uniref:Uncharacterized protein n=1 Tax=Petrolisthes cinctipes TaxID=88211 RepID=A0AAE1KYJ1_PETCI|nr:hypothetical protein Pcinc_005936 [Petrolisthes cinctipes]